ncbi:MAG: CaiB/BaiF CoA transferase family protein [Christensenellales bacterium]
MKGALSGIRILDMTRFIAGPFCAMILGDMGAEVIKIEKSGTGDDARTVGPWSKKGYSLYFAAYNRNKKSITVDFRNPDGIRLIKELVKQSDVLLENFRPGVMEKMGLSKDVLHELNPRLVISAVSGFGQYGPYRDRAAFDSSIQPLSGFNSLNGLEDSMPTPAGTHVSDFVAALYSAYGISMALYNREKTGKGDYLDIALLDGLVSIMATAIPNYLVNGEIPPRCGNRDKYAWPANSFKTSDGYVYVHAGTDALFKRFCQYIGREELLQDPRFATVNARAEHIEECEAILQEWIGDKTAQEVEDKLNGEAGLPAGKVNTIPDLVQHPQLKVREAILEVDGEEMGLLPMAGITVKSQNAPGRVYSRPPYLGEHNYEVYGGLLHLSKEEIDGLLSRGVI